MQRSCKKTLENHKNSLFSGVNSLSFQQIKNDGGVNVIDLSNTSLMESEYALKGALFFELKCKTPSCSCPPSTSPANPCIRTWDLSLVTQSLAHDVTIFNKPEHLLHINIEFLTISDFTCTLTESPCVYVKGNKKQTLVGCGTTTKDADKAADEATAYGYNAGHKDAGNFNTFIGHSSGEKTTGESNTFIGHRTGNANTSGAFNTFLGQNAGGNASGTSNTFIGQDTGENASGSGNVFIGQGTGGIMPLEVIIFLSVSVWVPPLRETINLLLEIRLIQNGS